MTEQNAAIIPAGSTALAEFGQMVSDEAQGFDPTMVRLKILHHQAEFQIPSLPAVKRLEGVILASRKVRVFFPKMSLDSDTEGIMEFTGNRPFCSSADCITGTLIDIEQEVFAKLKADDPVVFLRDKMAEGALRCRDCPFGQWESVLLLGQEGRGQACKELRRLLFWKQGMGIPLILSVPSSSIRAWDGYCSSLSAAGMRHNAVVTEMTLTLNEGSGRKWSTVNFASVGHIEEDMAMELIMPIVKHNNQPLFKFLVDKFAGRELTEEDYPANGTKGDDEL